MIVHKYNATRPLSALPQRKTTQHRDNTNSTSFFFRAPMRFFETFNQYMRQVVGQGRPQPFFVLSAGCGLGKEPVSVVIIWLKVLEAFSASPEDFPLVVIALDAVAENLDALTAGEFQLNRWDIEQLPYYRPYFELVDPPDIYRVRALPHVLAPIHTTRMDLAFHPVVRSLRKFTPDGLGFHAVYCNSVTMYFDRRPGVKTRIEANLRSLLRQEAASDFFFLHNEYGGGND
ncbi:CheR family methyltransferase [Candidatus Margulisiibacteriota bacterium]